jgi:hypothetical protein
MNDPGLDSHFVARTDHPAEAHLFLAMPKVRSALAQLACSSGTFITIAKGTFELSELAIPQRPSSHVMAHLQSIARLATAMRRMPGSDAIVVNRIPTERHVLARAAIAVGMLATMLMVIGASGPKPAHDNSDLVPQAPGVLPADVSLITRIEGWHAATQSEFDAGAAAWLRSSGVPVSGRIPGDFSGTGAANDTAYVLIGPKGEYRIAILAQGDDRYDATYPAIAGAARVPKENLAGIHWLGSPPTEYDGDGLLLVRNSADPQSGLILLLSGRRIVSGVPVDFEQVQLK